MSRVTCTINSLLFALQFPQNAEQRPGAMAQLHRMRVRNPGGGTAGARDNGQDACSPSTTSQDNQATGRSRHASPSFPPLNPGRVC